MMTKLEKAIEYVDKLWKQQPNEFGIMPDLGNEFMWVVDFMKEHDSELEELKRDVARYFELRELQTDEAMFPTEYLFTDDDWRELYYLEEKLSKVGKENGTY